MNRKPVKPHRKRNLSSFSGPHCTFMAQSYWEGLNNPMRFTVSRRFISTSAECSAGQYCSRTLHCKTWGIDLQMGWPRFSSQWHGDGPGHLHFPSALRDANAVVPFLVWRPVSLLVLLRPLLRRLSITPHNYSDSHISNLPQIKVNLWTDKKWEKEEKKKKYFEANPPNLDATIQHY